MNGASLSLTIILSIVAFIVLTVWVCIITKNREDDTPMWEVIVICVFFTPVLALILEMLKPYKVKVKTEIKTKTITSTADITDEDLQRYLEKKNKK